MTKLQLLAGGIDPEEAVEFARSGASHPGSTTALEGVMISRTAISALAAFIVLGAVAAAPAEAALPLPRSAAQASAPAAGEPGRSPKSPPRLCVRRLSAGLRKLLRIRAFPRGC